MLEPCKRKACIFHLTRIDEEPALGVGRVGGLPDLPPDMEWPKGRDGYLPFLAQLPLDEARAAGALPIDVASGSLLTVFGSAGEDGVSANDALFVVSKHMQLERRRALADVDTYPWCKLETEIMEELPSWEEAVAMVKAELSRSRNRKSWSAGPPPTANSLWRSPTRACESGKEPCIRMNSTAGRSFLFIQLFEKVRLECRGIRFGKSALLDR